MVPLVDIGSSADVYTSPNDSDKSLIDELNKWGRSRGEADFMNVNKN